MLRRLSVPILAVAALIFCTLTASAQAIPPTIDQVAFSKVTTASANLEAEIDPQGKATTYRFEYGLADCASNPCTSIPIPDGELGSGSSPVPVSAEVKGLSLATTYHFRVVAQSEGIGGGTTTSADRAFTTRHLPLPFGPCPSDIFRKGKPSGILPDCRAYEQASPVDKNGGDARGLVAFTRASASGDAIGYLATTPIPGADGSQEVPSYLSTRGATGWSTQGTLPSALSGEAAFVLGWTPDFAQVFNFARRFNQIGGGSLLSRSTADGSISEIVPYGSGLGALGIPPFYAGAGADGSAVFFESHSKLTGVPAAIEGKPNLYAWDRDTGTISLAGALNDESPDGIAPTEGAFAGPYDWARGTSPETLAGGGAGATYYAQDQHAVTANGSVYFTVGKSGQLYLRLNPTKAQSPLDDKGKCTDPSLACTIHVSETQKTNGIGGGPDPAGSRPAAFMGATPDGSKAFFTSSEKLTDDANTGPELPPPSIARANLSDGSGAQLDFLPARAQGITIEGEHVYWADPENHAIGRAKLNGSEGASEEEPEFITGAGNPKYVAVDSEHVYWSNPGPEGDGFGPLEKGTGTIARADLPEGDNVDLDFITGASHPQGVAVDDEHIYWANAGDAAGGGVEDDATRTIGRADLNGALASVEQGFIPVGKDNQENRPQGLAINATHIYMGINGTQRFSYVLRFDIDGDPGSGNLLFLGQREDDNTGGVRGIALDAGHVYWAWQDAGTIGRADLELEGKELEFIEDAAHPFGLATDASRLYWSANQGAPPNPGNDLYRFDVATGKLTDVAPDDDVNGADVQGVLGSSDDGSHVYFVANGDLDGEGPAQVGDCKLSGFFQYSGECSLYLADEGGVEFIARLDSGGGHETTDAANWQPRRVGGLQLDQTARVSADGSTLLFRSREKLTAYENEGTPQLYRYRVGDPGPTCVSCSPTGEPPQISGPSFGSIALSTLEASASSFTLSRNLSDDGNRVFFETTEALVPADTNGDDGCPFQGTPGSGYIGVHRVCIDVYEWEAKGTGSCSEDVQGGGCLYLLSSGKSTDASYIADASASGDDVFLLARSQLVGQDEDQLYDVYSASVGGGLASQYPVSKPICEAEGCKPAASAPPQSESAGSASFSGPSNPKARKPKPRCAKGKRRVRSKGKTRCVGKGRKRAKHSKKANRRAGR